MTTRAFQYAMLCGFALLLLGCATRAVTDTAIEPKISVTTPEQVAAADDPFNTAMLSNLAPGMVVRLRVTPTKIDLEQAYILLTPKFARYVTGPDDRIVATLSGEGVKVSEVAATDPTVLIEEDFGDHGPKGGRVIRKDDRSVALSLPIPRRVDTLDVTVTATGQTAHFDVSKLMGVYCSRAPRAQSCQRAIGLPASR